MIEVKKRSWVVLDGPRLELELTDGRWVEIAWDTEYACRNLFVAASAIDNYESCTGERTGLSEDVLGPLVDEVEKATRSLAENDRAEWMGDAMNLEDLS